MNLQTNVNLKLTRNNRSENIGSIPQTNDSKMKGSCKEIKNKICVSPAQLNDPNLAWHLGQINWKKPQNIQHLHCSELQSNYFKFHTAVNECSEYSTTLTTVYKRLVHFMLFYGLFSLFRFNKVLNIYWTFKNTNAILVFNNNFNHLLIYLPN